MKHPQQQAPQWQRQVEQQQQEGLLNSFKKGSKFIAKEVLPVLGLGSGSALAAAGGLAASKLATDKPTPAAVAPMPDEDQIVRARRRSVAAQMARSGRASTILTGDGETLG